MRDDDAIDFITEVDKSHGDFSCGGFDFIESLYQSGAGGGRGGGIPSQDSPDLQAFRCLACRS